MIGATRPVLRVAAVAAALVAFAAPAAAQDGDWTIEGTVTDASSAAVAGAKVSARHLDTGFDAGGLGRRDGAIAAPPPVGAYRVTVDANGFASLIQQPVQVNVGQTLRINPQLALSSVKEAVTVSGTGQLVDTSSNALGPRRHGTRDRPAAQRPQLHPARAAADGRRAAHGRRRHRRRHAAPGAGLRRQRHAARAEHVSRRRRPEPESHGRRLRAQAPRRRDRRVPHPDPERATRIWRHRRGHHGGRDALRRQPAPWQPLRVPAQRRLRRPQLLLERGRAAEAAPVRRHDRRPAQANRLFFFGYYEGFRNEQGLPRRPWCRRPRSARATSPAWSVRCSTSPPAAAVPRQPDSRRRDQSRGAERRQALSAGNVSPSIYRETVVGENKLDQAGARVDFTASSNDQIFARDRSLGRHNLNPASVRGTDLPGYPTRDDLATHSAPASATRVLSPTMTHAFRAQMTAAEFFFDQRLNQTPPSALGFGYESSNAEGQGPPFFNVAGYSPVGGAITGPRESKQTTFELQDAVTWTRGRPPDQGRRRIPAPQHPHVPGHRAERASSCSRPRSPPTMRWPIS